MAGYSVHSSLQITDGVDTALVSPSGGLITSPGSSASTSTSQTSVNDSATAVTLITSNSNRKGLSISNDSSAVLYLLVGSGTPSTTNYTVRISQYGYFEMPYSCTVAVQGIWASDPNDGGARITEYL